MKNSLALMLVGLYGTTAALQGCTAPASDESVKEGDDLTGNYTVGTAFTTLADVQQRAEPNASGAVVATIAKDTVVKSASAKPRDGWYGVTKAGKTGWVEGKFLKKLDAAETTGGAGGKNVPYECQYTNGIDEGEAYGANTCATTSTSMALRYFGVNLKALAYYKAYRSLGYTYNDAKDFSVIPRILEKIPETRGKFVTRSLTAGQGGSTADLKKALDEGYLVVVGANLFNGHVILVTGYDSLGIYVNDPAGVWHPSYGNSGSAYDKCSGGSNNASGDLISWSAYRQANVVCGEAGRAVHLCPSQPDLWMFAIKAK